MKALEVWWSEVPCLPSKHKSSFGSQIWALKSNLDVWTQQACENTLANMQEKKANCHVCRANCQDSLKLVILRVNISVHSAN